MKFKIALCQMAGSFDKSESMNRAESFVVQAADNGAKIVSLPEMWNCPYANEYFRPYAETADGETVAFLSRLAKENDIYLVGGSIPELDDGNVYNTSFIFDRKGKMIGRHRKAHLFDIDVKGGIRFMESDTLTAGDTATVVDTEYCRVGVAICYDVRFPELTRKMALEGAKLVILPAAFNMTTGPVHWEMSMKARALDNQVYFAANGPARSEDGPYVAYGHSMIVDPWGTVISSTEEKEDIVYGEIDTDRVDSVRDQLPLLKHRREELY
ncbi:MAG: carbon-nitrogen hydrolase family protein [Eubacteriaceae bacterium]|nr:carbon-nitrogen hydrolase family protein [Eubacteriaceae bacterium]